MARALFLAVLAAALSLAVVPAAALPELPAHARGGRMWAEMQARELRAEKELGIVRNSTANIFQQLVWHNDTSKGTFDQHWFWDQTYFDPAKTGSPILFYISGEGPCGGTPGGYTAVLAQQLGALIVTMEHRYYGASLPAPLTDEATFRSLSVDTQMEDMAAFLLHVRTLVGDADGTKFPIVTVGGSYAGALSAWFREKHPELATMSWSSSGVVNAVYNFTGFDAQVAEDIEPIGACASQVRTAMQMIEAAWQVPAQRTQLLALFSTPSYFTEQDFLWMAADAVGMGPQYGYKAQLCEAMLDPSGDPLQNLAKWATEHYGPSFGSSCYYSTVCLSDPTYADQWPNQRSWVFQCCTQLAYWNVNSGNASVRSPLLDTAYFDAQCEAAFGTRPNTTDFNDRYGGSAPNTTRVVALNGSDDPWRRAAVNGTLGVSYPEFTATCDGCGHCGDLRTPSPSQDPGITTQQAMISAYITTWLGELAGEERGAAAAM